MDNLFYIAEKEYIESNEEDAFNPEENLKNPLTSGKKPAIAPIRVKGKGWTTKKLAEKFQNFLDSEA